MHPKVYSEDELIIMVDQFFLFPEKFRGEMRDENLMINYYN